MTSDKDKKLTYKDLRIWEESNKLFFMIVEDCAKLPRNNIAYVISNQIIRSMASISANIAEGSGRGTTKDLVRFLIIARGSLVESMNWIEKLVGIGYISSERGDEYMRKLEEIKIKINALIGSLRKKMVK